MTKNTKISIFAKVLIFLVGGYRYLLSPVLGSNCRYHPTCSSYAIEAIKLHGAGKGLAMGAWRIVRCNPFSKGGYEPVSDNCKHAQFSAHDDKVS